MSNLETACKEIHHFFVENGYGWKRDGELVTPTPADVMGTILRLCQILDESNEPDGSLVETGRIMIKKDGDKFDIWQWVGETDGRTIRS